MRQLVPLIAVIALGCGDKTPPAAAGDTTASTAPAPAVAEAPPEEEAPPVVDEAPATPVKGPPNADFNASLAYADGRTVSGHVVRVERGEDWYAEEGWTDKPVKLTVSLEQGGSAIDAPWTDIKQIEIRYAPRTDVSCLYDSEYDPWMYMCVLPTTTKVTTTDGKTWEGASRFRWRFTFDDDTSAEFYVYKLPAREQDTVGGGLGSSENTSMYAKLQDAVAIQARSALTRITISR